jgi:predicted MFS family arabinose efflux permease
MTAPLEVLYARRFGAGNIAVGVFVMSSALGVLAVDVFGTRFVPRLEPRTALSIGIIAFGASCLGMGVSPTFAPLVAARIVQGAASAVMAGAGLQATVRVHASRERALGSFNSALLLGSAVGAPTGGLVATLLPGTAGHRSWVSRSSSACSATTCAAGWRTPPSPSSVRHATSRLRPSASPSA